MSERNEERKRQALGMPIGTASNRLRKNILFALICHLKRNTCYRCGEKIYKVAEFSIEHRQPWLSADDPKVAFFDLGNIAFSHLRCNSSAASKPHKVHVDTKAKQRYEDRKKWADRSLDERKADRRRRYEKYGC